MVLEGEQCISGMGEKCGWFGYEPIILIFFMFSVYTHRSTYQKINDVVYTKVVLLHAHKTQAIKRKI